jgi:Raf kinase inhibitor-like YbhB/YbcL family protein
MQLSSPEFDDNGPIPSRFTCDGENLSPPLRWSDAPEGTRSFVVLCEDPDAPTGLWRHWAAFDIPSDRTGLDADADRRAETLGFRRGVNDFHKEGYGGPCPPRDHGVHRYRFRLLALSVDRLPAGAHPSWSEIERAARRHALAEASLVGLYER